MHHISKRNFFGSYIVLSLNYRVLWDTLYSVHTWIVYKLKNFKGTVSVILNRVLLARNCEPCKLLTIVRNSVQFRAIARNRIAIGNPNFKWTSMERLQCPIHNGESFVWSSMTYLDINTVVGDNINIMKTTYELNFDFYQAFKQNGYTKIWKQRKAINFKSFTLITCKLLIRKKLGNN